MQAARGAALMLGRLRWRPNQRWQPILRRYCPTTSRTAPGVHARRARPVPRAGRAAPPRPASNTNTSSAASAVDSRCAIETVVRPRVSAVQRAGEPHLGRRVDRGGRLVQHQQVRVGHVRPGQRDQLPLPRRQRLAALPDPGGQALGQPVEPVAQAERPRTRPPRSASVAPGRAVADVVGRWCPSNRKPSCGTITTRARSEANGTRSAAPRRSAPARESGPSAGSAAWRRSSCPSRSPRPPRPGCAAGSSTSTSCSTGGPPG